MSKKLMLTFALGVILGVAGILVAQQEYPNVDDPGVVLVNDHVVVQKMQFEPGEWTGVHSHAGNQLVVVLDDIAMIYKDEGGERQEHFEAGTVFWVDAVEHDHKLIEGGEAVLVTVK
jgi:quercetin dioxygenase-like cupin family protein